MREAATVCLGSAPCKLILKVVSGSHVTWATSVPVLVFLGLSVLKLGPMYATDRQTSVVRRQTKASLKCLPLWGRRRKHNSTFWNRKEIKRVEEPEPKLELEIER